MKLDIKQLKEITTGAIDILEENGSFTFRRFNKEQDALYRAGNKTFLNRALAPAGVRFNFKTNSKNLFMNIKTEYLLPRKYFSLDVLVDGEPIGYIDNFSELGTDDYINKDYQVGEFSKNFELGEGEKTVCVHLPFSVKMELVEISLDDGAVIKGIKPAKKLLAIGDSITQGYDALRPSNRYVAKIADKLGAEEINKAVGGEIFFPKLAELKDDFDPEYVIVAYGTNDWTTSDKETFKNNCRDFYANIAKNYPNSKIFALSPLWRKDHNEVKGFGPFAIIEESIKDAASQYENMTFLSGFDLVPADENFYSDSYLHPNDKGFEYYIDNLYEKIKKEI